MSTHTQTDDSRRPTPDAPAWVRADRAALAAWTHDKAWRKAARSALPPVHRAVGNGGTVGDQLLAQARRNDRRQGAGGRRAAKEDRRHAEHCICPPCRKRRGERPLLTLKQQQERRKRTMRRGRTDNPQYDAGDDWRISEETLVRFTSLCEIYDDGDRHDVLCWLRTDFAQHLDALHLFDGLQRLLDERPGWACALIACKLLGRTTTAVGEAEGVADTTIGRRCERAAGYLQAIYNGQEPDAGRQRAEGSGAVMAELDEASRLARCADVSTYLRRVALATP